MSDVISEYQKWKQQGDDLRVQAKQAMESRFRELLSEAAQIAAEYRADFGSSLKPPPSITAFRYKSSSRSKAKKNAPKHGAAGKKVRESPQPESPAAKPNPKIAGLQKRLTTAKKKLDEAKAAGKPTRSFEDRVYEIEDELRLSGHA
jgi:hypothetical protein